MRYRTQRRFGHVFRILDIIRRAVLGVVFWSLVIAFIISLLANRPPRMRTETVLMVSPVGTLTDDYTAPTSYQGLSIGQYMEETLLDDLIRAIERGKDDERILGIWLRLDTLYSAGPAAAGELADALIEFSASGKPIIASADTYDTSRYRIASAADHIVLDRLGEVFPSGYGLWRAYLAEGIEKIGGDVRLFRSGESKSAAENLILSGMSEAARQDEERLLGDLWREWIQAVAEKREIQPETLEEWIANYDTYLIAANGNASASAKNVSLIDEIETGGVLQERLTHLFGEDFATVDAIDYITRLGPGRLRKNLVAVVPVAGTLVYGEGNSGQAGSSDVVSVIETARSAPGVRAIVLRIDSPGGDVRAGEAIRRSILETREDYSLPVVASLGNIAASGGYWIALEADLIVTRPETITGSIGVFSVSMSFQRGLADFLGIRFDGLGTTPWFGAGHPGRILDERTASLYEAGVADIDTLFKNLVSEKRGLTFDEVESMAGGIPWSGRRALELGLADRPGSLQDARRYAAELAGLEEWSSRSFTKTRDLREVLLNRILWGSR